MNSSAETNQAKDKEHRKTKNQFLKKRNNSQKVQDLYRSVMNKIMPTNE